MRFQSWRGKIQPNDEASQLQSVIPVTNASVTAVGVRKSFGKLLVLRDLNLWARPGEILALIGRNGAGKSTAFRLLTGLSRPDDGEISIAGFDLVDQPTKAKARLGYSPEHPALYDVFTPLTLLTFVGALHQLPADEISRRASILFSRFGIEDARHRRLGELSKGTAQKSLMASCVIHNPEVVILDEPFSGLDPSAREVLVSYLREFAQDGRTVLFSTHSMQLASTLASRVCVLHDGRIVADGSVEQIASETGTSDLAAALEALTH